MSAYAEMDTSAARTSTNLSQFLDSGETDAGTMGDFAHRDKVDHGKRQELEEFHGTVGFAALELLDSGLMAELEGLQTTERLMKSGSLSLGTNLRNVQSAVHEDVTERISDCLLDLHLRYPNRVSRSRAISAGKDVRDRYEFTARNAVREFQKSVQSLLGMPVSESGSGQDRFCDLVGPEGVKEDLKSLCPSTDDILTQQAKNAALDQISDELDVQLEIYGRLLQQLTRKGNGRLETDRASVEKVLTAQNSCDEIEARIKAAEDYSEIQEGLSMEDASVE